jgi:hypothetical protein
MKAKSFTRFAQFALVVLLGVFSLASSARAQSVQGSFELPVTVHWGIATLPAGHYTFTIDDMTAPFTLRVTGKEKSAAIMASGGFDLSQLLENSPSDAQQKLSLVETRKGWAVSALKLPKLGVALYYKTPPASDELLSKNSPRKPLLTQGE